MATSTRNLLVVGLVLLGAVATLAVRETRADLLFFIPAPAPARVEVQALRQPAGLSLYLELYGADDQATRSDGQLELVISDSRGAIYQTVRSVRAADFSHVRLPGDTGLHWRLGYGVGWLGYETDLGGLPVGPWQVAVTFTPTQGIPLGSVTVLPSPPSAHP